MAFILNMFKSSGSFNPRKSKARKAKLPLQMENCPNRQKEFGVELDEVRVKLGVVTCTLQPDGEWINDVSSTTHGNGRQATRELLELRARNEKLVKERDMYRVKNEILLDMVSMSHMELEEMTDEAWVLKGILGKSPLRFAELH